MTILILSILPHLSDSSSVCGSHCGFCLDRRVPDKAVLSTEVAAWHVWQNEIGGTVDWRFSSDDARVKLKRLYPSLQE